MFFLFKVIMQLNLRQQLFFPKINLYRYSKDSVEFCIKKVRKFSVFTHYFITDSRLFIDSDENSTNEYKNQPEVKRKLILIVIQFLIFHSILLTNVIYQHQHLSVFYSRIILISILRLMMLHNYVIILV